MWRPGRTICSHSTTYRVHFDWVVSAVWRTQESWRAVFAFCQRWSVFLFTIVVAKSDVHVGSNVILLRKSVAAACAVFIASNCLFITVHRFLLLRITFSLLSNAFQSFFTLFFIVHCFSSPFLLLLFTNEQFVLFCFLYNTLLQSFSCDLEFTYILSFLLSGEN